MSLFKNKNVTNVEPVLNVDSNTPVQDTPPTDNSKVWVDTSDNN
jgi:hypothetical protein